MQKLTLTIRRGASADIPVRVESDSIAYAAITAMAKTAPLRVTAPTHGIPDDWRAGMQNAGGMTNLNTGDILRDADLRRVTRVDANTLDFDGVNATAWRAYTSGGQVAYYAPLDLSVYTSARMDVRDAVDGALLAAYNTAAGTIEIDPTNGALWIRLTVAQTLLLAAGSHFFDLEIIKSNGNVDAVCSADSTLIVLPEITTSE